jgi:hypothetical protein
LLAQQLGGSVLDYVCVVCARMRTEGSCPLLQLVNSLMHRPSQRGASAEEALHLFLLPRVNLRFPLATMLHPHVYSPV